MEKLSMIENMNFLWNDVACLSDDNCSFIICKSMVKMPRDIERIGLLEKVEVKEISRQFTHENDQLMIKGDVAVAIAYETEAKEQAEIAFKVPYAGEYQGTLERSNTPQVAYVNGQAVGYDNVLLETVLAIPNSSGLYRESSVILGSFSQNKILRLDEQWPEISQIIGTQIEYFIEGYGVNEAGELQLSGQEQIGILYAGGNASGEKVILHQDTLPFEVAIPLAVRVEEFAQLQVGYFSLTAQIISDREVQISGYCHVRASAEESPDDPGRAVGAEDVERFSAQTKVELESVTPPQPSQAQINQAQVSQPQMNQETQQGACNNRPVSYSNRGRASRRDQLQKHMRNLDRGVRTPQCTRNIDFTQNNGSTISGGQMPEALE